MMGTLQQILKQHRYARAKEVYLVNPDWSTKVEMHDRKSFKTVIQKLSHSTNWLIKKKRFFIFNVDSNLGQPTQE